MKRLLVLFTVAVATLLQAADSAGPAAVDAVEKQLGELVASPQVTIVHLWAPWCGNCKTEMRPDGWAKFIADNPDVKFVFVNIWHKDQDPVPKLTAGGLGKQPNLLLLTHPNASRKGEDRLNQLLGLPITWVPTTWVFREGKMRFAFNYGEIRFELLQQLIKDTRDTW